MTHGSTRTMTTEQTDLDKVLDELATSWAPGIHAVAKQHGAAAGAEMETALLRRYGQGLEQLGLLDGQILIVTRALRQRVHDRLQAMAMAETGRFHA